MKNIYSIVTVLMLISMSSCNPIETDDSMVISLMEDVTEQNYKTRPQGQTLISHLNLNNNPWKGITFRYTTVSELDYNKQIEVSLIQENRIIGNSYLRKKKVQEYTNNVMNVIEQPRSSVEQTQSAIFCLLFVNYDIFHRYQQVKKYSMYFLTQRK